MTDLDNRKPSEIYGVTAFDLTKKVEVMNLANPIVTELLQQASGSQSLTAFSLAVNELHFEDGTRRLVSLEQAREVFRDSMGQNYTDDNVFEKFITDNSELDSW